MIDCCGHAHGHPHALGPWLWGPLPAMPAMLAGAAGPPGSTESAKTAENTSAALAVLRRAPRNDATGGKRRML